ncbi:protrudin isoform X7 [Xenopus tropicalis]|uniref:Protrudin n=2 Tax=Xenopus tropicalis TaxID=8364 RepID=A0A8J0T452_XENTR|nr:protrudin isoform X7 [Xenopus tropicalis]|eukprot:XP_017950744.1 PREDICTED: protrudin isoform X8 [Xenopus tropicalis]
MVREPETGNWQGIMQPAERDASSLGGSSWSEGSPTMTESHSESPQSTTKVQAFDLFNLVVSYKRIEIYLEPIKDSWEGIKYLLRWQMPLCSFFTCITLNLLLLTLNEVAWFSVGALFISIPALIGYLQEMSKIHIPEPELARRKYYSVRREELQKVKLSRQEAVAEFKSFLIHLESILNLICGSCERVYQVLYWQNPTASFQLYGLLLGAVCIIYLLPLYWVLAIVNSTLFLKNSDFYRVVAECKASLQQKGSAESVSIRPAQVSQEVENGSILDRTPTPVPTSSEDLSPGSVEEAEEAEPDEEFKDAIEDEDDVSQCTAEYDNLQDNGFLSKNEVIKSKVSKLTEKLRKRYPTNNLGTCTGCNATFSVLTRKRRSCTNCGNILCSRCCSYKVAKSVMGATAPDAQRETVFVCGICNQALSK